MLRHLIHHDLGPFGVGRPRVRALLDMAWWAAQAVVYLALARIRFARFTVPAMQATNRRAMAAGTGPGQTAAAERDLIARVAFVVPRVAARLPWRSDCLVQAMAAQQWLQRRGIASEIAIGVETASASASASASDFSAHAWLRHGDVVITGGDIADYAVLVGDGETGA